MVLLLAVLISIFLFRHVQAQCEGPSITITTLDDAQAISNCSVYNGNIIIDSSASGHISFETLESVTGNLIASNATGLVALHAPSVTTITGAFELIALTNLTTLDFPSLTNVGMIQWSDLPALQSAEFEAGLYEAMHISISNTGLLNLSGFQILVAGYVDVFDNPGLETVDLNDIENVTNCLSFRNNAPNLNIQLGSLQFVYGNLTFQNISALSTPDLQNVTGSFICQGCTIASYRSQWLMMVGDELAFQDTGVSDLEFPDLTYTGRLTLTGNDNLKAITGFTMLEIVNDGMFLEGTFDSVSFAENLGHVGGYADITTTSSNMSICEYFDYAHHDGLIDADVTCQTSVGVFQNNATDDSLNGVDSSSSSNTGGLTGGVIAGITIGAIAVIAALGLAAFFFLRRETHGRLSSSAASRKSFDEIKKREYFGELPHDSRSRVELYGDHRAAREMDGSDKLTAPTTRVVPGIYEADTTRPSGRAISHHLSEGSWRGGSSNDTSTIVSPMTAGPRRDWQNT